MIGYLPDTNIFIRAAKGYSPESELLSKLIKKKQIKISSIVAGEFLSKATSQEEKAFEKLLNEFIILSVNLDAARIAAKYRKMSLKTKKVHLLDCFLAAQAKLNKLTLITHNKSDFPMTDVQVITP
ncbi:PIN domain-containing protein [Candidatus Daviesbacteria bacterium]|nr:PIN domain-containing protein [Candidatus Daviesbacteria bacterium]